MTRRSRPSLTASSSATADDRRRRSSPRTRRFESRTALTRGRLGTPLPSDGSIDDRVDAALVADATLAPDLFGEQPQLDLGREEPADQPEPILHRQSPRQT